MAIKVSGINVIDDGQNLAPVGIVTVGTSKISSRLELGVGVTFDGTTGNVIIAGSLTAGTVQFSLGLG
jgi:hypothetical protein